MSPPPLRTPPAEWHSPSGSALDVAGARARLAALAGVDEDRLTVLEVPPACNTLYLAALEYAVLHPRGGGGGSGDAAAPLPLYNSHLDQYEAPSDSDSDASDNASDDSCSDCEDVAPRAGRGLKKRKVPRPRLLFGLGETAVTWPPPVGTPIGPASKKGRVGATGVAHVNSSCPRKVDAASKPPAAERASKRADAANNSTCANNVATASASRSKPKQVYMAHTAVGDPVSNHGGGATVYRILILASAHGQDALRAFANGVCRWHADRAHRPPRPGRFGLYRFKTDPSCRRGWWSMEGLKRARPMSSVILPKGQLEEICGDVEAFLDPETKAWYIDHGLPHRRAFIFTGPPGVGKTSCIRAIASAFKLNCCFLSTTCRAFSNQILGDAIASVPQNTLLVLEDVDALFNEDRKADDAGSLTFSGMLNALDGFLSADGIITIMTTNHIERLDPALIRGGRVDRRFDFARPVQTQISDLFLSFYPKASRQLADRFAAEVFARREGDEARSIATLQQLFINQRRSTAEECVEAIPTFFDMHFPDGAFNKKISLYM